MADSPRATPGVMIRFRLAAILKQRGWSPYRLARATGLTVPTAYRLADPDLVFGRFTADTLDRITGRSREQIALGRREIYVDYRDGIGTSKLKIPAAKAATGRNINTVAKLATMAAEITER